MSRITQQWASWASGLPPPLNNDDRAQIPNYSANGLRWNIGNDALWPRSSMRPTGLLLCDTFLNSAEDIWDWQFFVDTGGAVGQRRDQLTGVTRDANGNPLAGVTVKLFDKLTDQIVDQVISNANGVFAVSTPYTGLQVYAIGYLAGTPVFGTTAILTPS